MTAAREKQPTRIWQTLFAWVAGIFLGLCLLKFGNPIILENEIVAPSGVLELIYMVWPTRWGYFAVAALLLIALKVGRWKRETPKWVLIVPLIWLTWQFIAATQTVSVKLTEPTLWHFSACALCFYIGWYAMSEVADLRATWIIFLISFLFVLKSGFAQHFGGLAASREYFKLYILPTLPTPPSPDYLKKIESTRIFGPLFYPNSLGGAILMALPITFFTSWAILRKRTQVVRCFGLAVLAFAALACLFWSGSKSGWLLALVLGIVAVLHTSVPFRIKVSVIVLVFVGGGLVFGLRHAGYFKKGATSVEARFDYWRAAVQTTKEHPAVGTGPGTFMVPYAKIKKPESEMARLVHNDYLEQASDAGIVSFAAFSLWVWGSLIVLYRKRNSPMRFAVWLGLLGLALQSLAEFHFYIPGLVWPWFLLLGWMWGVAGKTDATIAPEA